MIGRRAAAFLVAAHFAAPAFAEDQKPAATPPVGAEPQTTTASYGDWTLRCQRLADPAVPSKLCEISLTIQAGQPQTPIAQIALGRLAKADPYHLTAHLPTNISLPSVVKLSTAGKDGRAYELAWRRCAPAGCFADSTLTDAQWKDLRGQTESGSLEFVDAVGRPVKLPVSFRGLAQALDALTKE